ncbi:hypothetical protein B0H14DRAFT_3676637 [Mycena olivaceomarginata]|nr:hypothetical protein B0H14DRAFT_3676637 [Mycena olivaceomarginata]
MAHTCLPLKGEQPTLNDWESFVIDHRCQRLYSYGGVRPYDKTIAPTLDFHCLDLKTMEWRNLCPVLRVCPLACTQDQLEFKKLPALMEPASALVSLAAIRNQLFIFGSLTQWNDDSLAIATYSVAIYDQQGQWTWAISDESMPPETPPLGYGIQAIPIDDEEKILLRKAHNTPVVSGGGVLLPLTCV